MNLIRRLAFRIGRRGSFLLFLSILDVLYGWALLTQISPRHVRPIDLLIPPKAWAILWISVGAVCLVQAFARVDRIAFSCATAIKACWGITLFYSWAFTNTSPNAWPSAVIFLAFAGLTAIVSFWPEHRQFNLGDLNGDTE